MITAANCCDSGGNCYVNQKLPQSNENVNISQMVISNDTNNSNDNIYSQMIISFNPP